MLNKLELKILKRAFSICGALIWNSIPLSIKTLKKNQFKSELKGKLFEILEKEDGYIRVSDITVQFSSHNMVYFRNMYSLPSCLTLAINHTTN